MAEIGERKKKSNSGNDPNNNAFYKKQKTVATSTIMSANNTTTIATKTLLDDAHDGFKNGNFVCSPLSLDIVLGMLAAGAEGETLKQLLGFLGHESIDQLLTESPTCILFSNILSKTRKGGEDLEFSLVNCIWVDKKVAPVRSSYQKVLETVYKTEARYVDFNDKVKCGKAVREINTWVRKVTKGLIPAIVNSFRKDDLMVLANALYFKGAWLKPFIAKMTKNKYFNLINGEKVSVPFMTVERRELFDYGSFNGYKMIRLPYEINDELNEFSMYIFLPDRNDGLQNLLELFHSDGALFHGDFDLELEYISELWIPKFKISCTFDPAKDMEQMGLTLPFEKTNTELSGIVDMRGLYGNMLYVSKIDQFSFIEVDEKGTVAAACTRGLGGGGGRAPPSFSFVADHPFMFMIREDTSRAVLFVGAVLDPSAD